MNHEGVCRTAPATPGLLTSQRIHTTGYQWNQTNRAPEKRQPPLHCSGENRMLSTFSNVVKKDKENNIPSTQNYDWSELTEKRIYKQWGEFDNLYSQ